MNKIKKHNQNYMVLASSSPIRNSLLKGAGVKFTTIPANIDESSIKTLEKEPSTFFFLIKIVKPSTAFIRHHLQRHNELRQKHGCPPVTESPA